MRKLIIFDTNILVKRRLLKDIKVLIDQHKKIGDVYITETVLDEFTNFNYQIMKTEVVDGLVKYPFMYEILDINYDIENIHSKKTSREIKHTIKKLFEDKIIGLNTIELEEVYGRAIRKIPPFDSSKKSDKGFKDTLIWLSIINYDYTNYSEVFFITNDSVFKKYEDNFQEEFTKKHNKSIFIYSDLLSENINESDKKIEKNEVSEIEKNIDIHSEEILEDYLKTNDFRSNLEHVLDEIILITVREYDAFDNSYDHTEYRFHIQRYINIDDLELFRLHLNKLVKDNILSYKIRASLFLEPYSKTEDITEKHHIEIESIVKLSKIISEFQKALPNYTSAFLSVINDRINTETYLVDIPIDTSHLVPFDISDDDLPFWLISLVSFYFLVKTKVLLNNFFKNNYIYINKKAGIKK